VEEFYKLLIVFCLWLAKNTHSFSLFFLAQQTRKKNEKESS